MSGLTRETLIIGTYILMAIVGIETGILVGLVQRAGSIRKLFKLTSQHLHDNSNQPTEYRGNTTENPQIEKKSVESDQP
jgi:hypothetical protein